MLTRFTTFAAAAVLVLNALACGGQAQTNSPAPTNKPAPTPSADITTLVFPSLPPEEIAHIKNLVFADTPLREFLRDLKRREPDTQEEPGRSLHGAAEDIERGRPAEAKRKLKQVLAMPVVETRMRLLVWNTLRGLGERPPAESARQVQGVVCELHNEAGVGTLAVYADGGVRWIGGQGKVSVIDLPGEDADLDSLVRDMLKAGEPLVKMFPAGERRRPGEPPLEHFRITVLTYGGIHVNEVYGPGVMPGNFMEPFLYLGGRLAGEVIPAFEERHQAAPTPSPVKP